MCVHEHIYLHSCVSRHLMRVEARDTTFRKEVPEIKQVEMIRV